MKRTIALIIDLTSGLAVILIIGALLSIWSHMGTLFEEPHASTWILSIMASIVFLVFVRPIAVKEIGKDKFFFEHVFRVIHEETSKLLGLLKGRD